MSRADRLPPWAHNLRVGSRLREARSEAGLTLAEVEERTDGELRAATVGAYERGIRAIAPERLIKLANLYGVEPADIDSDIDLVGLDGESEEGVIDISETDARRRGTQS